MVNYKKGKVILDFAAYSFCAPCRRIKPAFEKLSEQYEDIKFYTIETDIENEEFDKITAHFNVECLPTFLFLHNGEVISKLEGADESKLKLYTEKLHKL